MAIKDLLLLVIAGVICLIFIVTFGRVAWRSFLALPNIPHAKALDMMRTESFKVAYEDGVSDQATCYATYHLTGNQLLVVYRWAEDADGYKAEQLQIKMLGYAGAVMLSYVGDKALHFNEIKGELYAVSEGSSPFAVEDDFFEHDAEIIRRVRMEVSASKVGPRSLGPGYVDPLPDQLLR